MKMITIKDIVAGISGLGVWFCGGGWVMIWLVGVVLWWGDGGGSGLGVCFWCGVGGGSDLGVWFCCAGWEDWGRSLYLIG